ncbi:uncharacterized protein LOC119729765 [Patiria miniata]|uniref:DUF4440 domain-containing protein n=1 Tax=Patiria miniata TaxID=46514 RepID=A0A914A3M0_PATMI|nr:uncharacterized protein LOC119729468 [Patiria miniata]XP_038058433.1 uncharacterized protein LOC119729765 [Patiria miniata]
MSAFTWLCVFLLVGLLNAPIKGNIPPAGGEVEDHKEESRGIAYHPAVDEIVELGEELGECLMYKDKDCLLSMYADDVLVVPDGHAAYEGIENVEQNLGWLEYVDVIKHPAEHIEPLGPSGDYVLEVHAQDSILPDGSHKKGKTTLIWKRIDGEFYVIFQMSNDEY